MKFAGFFSGIADEAAKDIDRQILAHKELGWKHIELRNIAGKNLTDLPEEQFIEVRKKIEDAGLQVSCFASQLANWSRPISGDFELDLLELRRAIPRMQALGTPYIRCMSYPNAALPLDESRWRKEVIRRLKILAQMAEDGGVTLVHENCNGWGGLGPRQSMEMLAAVGLSSLQLLFDTGNPAQYGQDSWEYYQGVRDRVAYVHVKDYFQPKSKGDERACFPGEGCGKVPEILRDLISRGYKGGISIEPHLAAVIHRQQDIQDPQVAFRSYVEYGRRLEKLVAEFHQLV